MKNKHISYGIAVNGQEAVERWSNGDYHLVLVSGPLTELRTITNI
jgi:hypothetical protein